MVILALVAGGVIGYYIRQNLAKKRAGSLEAKLQKRVIDVKQETTEMVKSAEKKSSELLEKTQKDIRKFENSYLMTRKQLESVIPK